MKVLLINQTFYPDTVATAQQLVDLTVSLKSDGHEVSVLTGRRGYNQRERIYPKFEIFKGISIHRVGSTGLGKTSIRNRVIDSLTFDLGLLLKLIFFPSQDLVISFTSPPLVGVFGSLFCLFKGGKSIQWLMDINPEAAFEVNYVKRNSIVGRVLDWIFRFTLKLSHQVFVLDRWMKEKVEAFGVPATAISVIPPWPAQEELDEPDLQESPGFCFRKEYALEGKFVVAYSGNHSVVHPLDTVLDTALLLKDNNEIVFVFVGAGHRVKDVKQFIDRHNLKNIRQIPHQPRERLGSMMVAPDVHLVVMGNNMTGLVHTSKVYSVLASGKPYIFVGPQKSHVLDLLSRCPYGYHVEQGQSKRLAECISDIRGLSQKQLKEFQEFNTSYVKQECSKERSVELFQKAIAFPNEEKPLLPLTHEITVPGRNFND